MTSGHLDLGAAHVVPLGGLVGDLVGGHEREVHVHQLDHRPEADDRRADRRPADAGLADRGVEDALTPEGLQQPLRQLEGAAVVGDVLAVVDHPGVAGHLLDERLAQGVLVADRARGVALGDGGLGVGDDAARRLRDHVGRGVRVEVGQHVRRIGVGRLRRAHGGPGVALPRAGLDGGDRGVVGNAGLDELPLQALDRVDVAPGGLLLAGPVLVARVGQRVAVVAVGRGLDQDRPLAGAAEGRRPPDRVAHREDVHPVDDLGVHVVVGEAGATAREVAHAHDLFVGPVGHPVVVVLDQVDDRQPVGAVAGQVVGPLVLGRPVERLEDDPVGVGPVAGEAADDAVGLLVADRHRRARRDRHASADDRVGPQVAGREVADVHPAAAPAAVALLLAEELGDDPVDVLLEGPLEELLAGLGGRAGDAGPELLVRHVPDRREALGDRVAVAAVGARDVVVRPQCRRGADGRPFLADRDVGRAAVVVAGERVVAARAEPDDHLLQLADGEHVVEEVQRAGAVDPARRDLGRQVAGVGEPGDRPARLLEGREVGAGVAAVGGFRDHGAPPGDQWCRRGRRTGRGVMRR